MGRVYSDSESIGLEEETINPLPRYHSDGNFQSLAFHDMVGIGSNGDDGDRQTKNKTKKKKKKKGKMNSRVLLEGYVETGVEEEERGTKKVMARTKSLTGDHLDELKGCLDLGFGFNYEEIPELCNTLPALELCYSMSQRFLDEQQQRIPVAGSTAPSQPCSSTSSPIPNWRISGPGMSWI